MSAAVRNQKGLQEVVAPVDVVALSNLTLAEAHDEYGGHEPAPLPNFACVVVAAADLVYPKILLQNEQVVLMMVMMAWLVILQMSWQQFPQVITKLKQEMMMMKGLVVESMLLPLFLTT